MIMERSLAGRVAGKQQDAVPPPGEGEIAGDAVEAKKQALAALEIAPAFERAQDLLLKIVGSPGGGAR